jgi:phenylacetate-CoA ligase
MLGLMPAAPPTRGASMTSDPTPANSTAPAPVTARASATGSPGALLDAGERLGADELAALQLARLQRTLRHAYEHVEHYRRAFEQAGVKPEDCRSLQDLAAFPFTTKADLRKSYPFGMFAVPMDQVRRIHASSGTTGRPTVVGYTENDLSMWADMVARSIRAAGGRPGDKVHIAYGYGLFTGGLGAHYGAERAGCTVIPVSGGMTARQVQLIRDFEPAIIMVTPSYMLTLLDEFERQGVDPRSTSLRVGLFGAEPWTEDLRREIEQRAGIDAVDIYGLSEVIGPGVAQECVETKDGLHVWEDHFYPEVVDPATGAVLPPGELGELVFTSLTKEALPIIRYRTRDLTRLLPGTARPRFRRMQKVTGRCDDMIILRGVNLFPTQIEEIVLRTPALAPHFELELTRRGRMDHLTVRAEARLDADPAQRARAAEALAAAVKDGIGVSVETAVVDPDTLERSVGKLQRVRDLRGA